MALIFLVEASAKIPYYPKSSLNNPIYFVEQAPSPAKSSRGRLFSMIFAEVSRSYCKTPGISVLSFGAKRRI
jgi:hypothetical protein